jgi:hypothetical protein
MDLWMCVRTGDIGEVMWGVRITVVRGSDCRIRVSSPMRSSISAEVGVKWGQILLSFSDQWLAVHIGSPLPNAANNEDHNHNEHEEPHSHPHADRDFLLLR